MKLKQVIDLVDGIEPNAYTNEVKTAWLNEVEGMVQTDVMLRAIEDIDVYDWTDDQQTVLLVKPPHDKLYRFYLQAMIQLANAEYDRYQNTMTVFNEAWGEFVRWFSRTIYPAGREAIWKGYYLSAYGIAVAHGYGGTVEEWLESLRGGDGYSPTVSVTNIPGGHRVTVTDAQGTRYFDVMDGAGSGDMTSATYDPVGGARQVAFADEIPTTAAEVDAIPTSAKGAANGVAALDGSGKVPDAQLPLPWTAAKTYAAGAYCEYNGYLWHNTSGAASTGVEPGTNYNAWNVTYSNPNLLDNWYFGNPVNQRGSTYYQGAAACGLDRWWQQYDSGVTVNPGYITRSGYWQIAQRFEHPIKPGTYTVSAIVKGATSTNPNSRFSFWFTEFRISDCSGNEWRIISATGTIDSERSAIDLFNSTFGESYSIDIRAVKLELGSVSTLANDIAPNYAEELAKCQRYYYNWTGLVSGADNARDSSTVSQAVVFLPVEMRVTPAVSSVTYYDGNTSDGINIYKNEVRFYKLDGPFSVTGFTASAEL